jgi:hypothetical protein
LDRNLCGYESCGHTFLRFEAAHPKSFFHPAYSTLTLAIDKLPIAIPVTERDLAQFIETTLEMLTVELGKAVTARKASKKNNIFAPIVNALTQNGKQVETVTNCFLTSQQRKNGNQLQETSLQLLINPLGR